MVFDARSEESLRKKLLLVLNDCKISFAILNPTSILYSSHLQSFSDELLKSTKDYLENFDEVNIINSAFDSVIIKFELLINENRYLREIDGLVVAIADQVIEQLKRLPYEYKIYLDLGVAPKLGAESFCERIDNEFSIICHGKEDVEHTEKPLIKLGHYYLVCNFKGYIRNNSNHEKVLNIINKFKVIIYIGIMTKVLMKDNQCRWWDVGERNLLYINLMNQSCDTYKLSSDFGIFLNQYLFSPILQKNQPRYFLLFSMDLKVRST